MSPRPDRRMTAADPDWLAEAACRGMDPNIFAPWDPGCAPKDQDPALAEAALAVCRRCPVVAECGAERDRHTVRGGRTPAEQIGIEAGHTCPDCGRGCETAVGLGVHRRQAHGWVPPCGTPGGYGRHQRAGEPPCEECREAMNAYRRERAGLPPQAPAACGTPAGYRRHLRAGEPPCRPCLDANAAATRRRRRAS